MADFRSAFYDAFTAALSDAVAKVNKEPAFLGKPLSKKSPHKERIKWDKVHLRIANAKDADLIAGWIEGNDLQWLGGSTSAKEDFRDWISHSFAAFILLYPGNSEQLEEVAFANIAPLGPFSPALDVEIGRLIVPEPWRWRGFGTSLLHYLSRATVYVLSTLNRFDKHIYMRVHKDNTHGLSMLKLLPYDENTPPAGITSDESKTYEWFMFRPSATPSKFGQLTSSLRKERGLSQQLLAFQCGVTRATINMIENGRRNPSVELLQSLCVILGKTEITRIAMLLSLIGDTPSSSLSSLTTLTQEQSPRSENLWVITDWIAEVSGAGSGFLDELTKALLSGKERWYFIPSGLFKHEGKQLLNLLENRHIHPDVVSRYLRFYEAPDILCHLRIAIHDPVDFGAKAVTIEGKNNTRVFLPETSISGFVQYIRRVVGSLEKTAHKEYAGFSRLYPGTANDE